MKEGTKCLELYSFAKDKIVNNKLSLIPAELYKNQVRRTSSAPAPDPRSPAPLLFFSPPNYIIALSHCQQFFRPSRGLTDCAIITLGQFVRCHGQKNSRCRVKTGCQIFSERTKQNEEHKAHRTNCDASGGYSLLRFMRYG